MPNIQWVTQTFGELELDQLFDMLRLRVDVFVVEQQCAYPELDEYDRHEKTTHLSGRDDVGQLMAYARLLPPGLSFSEVSIGRFVVRKGARGQGVGHQLLQKALKESSNNWPGRDIRIAAQDYLQRFYERYGFLRISNVFLDHGVPHVEMLKKS